MNKKLCVFMALCTLILSPARAVWSYKYWYCPVSWSEAKVYFQIGLGEAKGNLSAIYVAGEGPLPDSNEDNTVTLDFQYRYGYLPSSRLPWRKGNSDLSGIVYDFGTTTSTTGTIVSVTVDEGITRIGNWWFHGTRYLNKVSLPSTLESIGEGAFCECAFGLSEISIPDKVKSIGSRAFYRCEKLKHFKIPFNSALGDDSEAPLLAVRLNNPLIINCQRRCCNGTVKTEYPYHRYLFI
jgi:hypothetical protein